MKMMWIALLLIRLPAISAMQDHTLEENVKIDTSGDRIENNLSSFRNSNLTAFIYTLSNSSSFIDYQKDSQSDQVDCFGLGKRVAAILEWFFLSNSSGNALDVQFLLSSRKQPRRVQVLIGKQFGLEWTDFQIERRTVVIVHGFLSHGQQSWINEMEKAFLRWNDVNVVIVDWSAGGNTWNYYKAAVNTKVIGYQIARFLEHVENATTSTQGNSDNNNWGPLHLVGHSLGAHICGFAAKELKKRRSKWEVQRITGLDPAQPCFKNVHPTMKLHKSDASFVDIIHTNGKLLSEIGLGLPEPIGLIFVHTLCIHRVLRYCENERTGEQFVSGHVDFYPNGGRSQPGCVKIDSSYFEYLPIPLRAINKSICSHGRSYVYLTESLISEVKHNCTFWAHHWDLSYRNLIQLATESCDNTTCAEMGINAINYPQRGTFFVATSNIPPFCVNGTRIINEVIMQLERDYADELRD